MPGLSVTEKSHWRDRIAKAVERIKARKPALFDRIAREAHAQALTSLGLADAYAELEAIKAEEALLARRKKQAQKSMVATLRSVPIDEVGDTFSVRYGGELGLALLSKLREEDGRPGVAARPSLPLAISAPGRYPRCFEPSHPADKILVDHAATSDPIVPGRHESSSGARHSRERSRARATSSSDRP